MSSKKWNDPQLDAAQFAIDRFLIAQQTVSEQMANPHATDAPRTKT
jgi:hypothetical protein